VPENEKVEDQLLLLDTHRRTLAVYLRQQALLGSAYAPPGVQAGIRESRTAINRIKNTLRSWGYVVEDQTDDDDPSIASIPSGLSSSVRNDEVIISHTQRIGDNANVGVAVSGDVHGNIGITDYSVIPDISNRDLLDKIDKCINLAENYIKANNRKIDPDSIEDMEDILRNLQASKRSVLEKKQERAVNKINQAYDIAVSIKNASDSENISKIIALLNDILERK